MKKLRLKMLRDLLRVTQLPTSMWSQLQKVLLSALHTAFMLGEQAARTVYIPV